MEGRFKWNKNIYEGGSVIQEREIQARINIEGWREGDRFQRY